MAADGASTGTKEERLKAALWYNVGKAVDAIAIDQDLNTTPYFIGSMSEMVWAQIELIARDIESFAKHAGHKVIGVDDVLLLARRNEGLHGILKTAADNAKNGNKD